MKKLLTLLICLMALTTWAQTPTAEFDGHKWEAPYELSIPKAWTIERFLIPIVFAREIPYTGVEDIRFAPGWADATSEQYWTYAFLWYLDGAASTNVSTLEKQLQAYYTGLLKINTDSVKLSTLNLPPAKVVFQEITSAEGDLQTFSGTIDMIDYMQLKPLKLHCLVHLKSCPGEKKTFIFYQLSPKSLAHGNWDTLKELWTSFKCKKN
ncbi:MAG: hypothetical protein Q7T76_17710 [Ferruginibacter sp.]|nr:hypothetical protein [Ferruginibacter sp.]